MLHASEAWPLTRMGLRRLQHNDRAVVGRVRGVEPEDVATVRSRELLAKLQLEDLKLILRERRLGWFGGAIRTACDIQIEGRQGQVGPSKHGRN